ncbi:hypothetical protein HMPREF1861_02336 [Corynebacterium kroppenstedtii]|nr:hypothetical protein HMPREF1861_02336 [Corynebacterium kroppenstedtii]
MGFCHGRACSGAVSTAQPRYPGKVWGKWSIFGHFRPYTPAVFGGTHIPPLFSRPGPIHGHLLSLVLPHERTADV